jgi:hypothetical protein
MGGVTWMSWLLVDSVAPVMGHEEDLPRAVADHTRNWKATHEIRHVEYLDDKVGKATLGNLDPGWV